MQNRVQMKHIIQVKHDKIKKIIQIKHGETEGIVAHEADACIHKIFSELFMRLPVFGLSMQYKIYSNFVFLLINHDRWPLTSKFQGGALSGCELRMGT